MVVILGSASKSQRDRGTDRRRSGNGRGGAGIESNCLSTISRSVNVMQRNKSAQAPVPDRSQVLGKTKTVSEQQEAEKLTYCESVYMVKNFSFSIDVAHNFMLRGRNIFIFFNISTFCPSKPPGQKLRLEVKRSWNRHVAILQPQKLSTEKVIPRKAPR